MKVEINISRISHLLDLYKIELNDLLNMISKGLKNKLTEADIITENVKISHLKRIDKVFNKGLHYYLDPKAPETSKESSIFFRKQIFNSELNLGAKKVVNKFEEFKIALSAISKLSELEFKRRIPIYKISDDPKEVALAMRKLLYPQFNRNLKDFLKELIKSFAEKNILVFEFVEYWNQKEKANIDGFFINPNVIVIKRQQNSFRREIFTLIHELGHFLLNEEEIEKLDYSVIAQKNLSKVERWCNDFAHYFLVGEYSKKLSTINSISASNDYEMDLIEEISQSTHLSKIALYTRLLLERKITPKTYNKIKTDFEEQFKRKQEEIKKQRELEKQNGIQKRGSAPQAIKSPLLISTLSNAFEQGVINEKEICQRLNIKPEKLDKYIL